MSRQIVRANVVPMELTRASYTRDVSPTKVAYSEPSDSGPGFLTGLALGSAVTFFFVLAAGVRVAPHLGGAR